MRSFLYALGLVFIAGAIALAAGYARYLSDIAKLTALLLTAAMFGFLGKYYQERGQ